jgi:adenylate cyclase
MGRKQDIENAVDNVLGTSFTEREGKVVPSTGDVANNQAVKINATFLYADLAGSATIWKTCPWDTTAKIIRSFLDSASRIIRAHGGEIRSFDGDRVMGVFIGDYKNTNATRAAREIFWATDQVIAPKAKAKFNSVKNARLHIKCCVGVDVGDCRAVRGGIRANNDLIWIGRAPSMAAKLSDEREFPYCVFIHKDTYNKLADAEKLFGTTKIWEARSLTFAGETHSVYRTNYYKIPPG